MNAAEYRTEEQNQVDDAVAIPDEPVSCLCEPGEGFVAPLARPSVPRRLADCDLELLARRTALIALHPCRVVADCSRARCSRAATAPSHDCCARRGSPDLKMLEHLDWEALQGVERSQIAQLAACEYVERAEDGVIAEPIGTARRTARSRSA